MTIQAERASGPASDYASLNGQEVTQSISGPQGVGTRKKAPPPQQAAMQESPTSTDTTTQDRGVQQQPRPSAGEVGGIAALLPTKETMANVPRLAQDITTLHSPPVLKDGRRALPDDAMLILTKDLYFTRSQMAVIGMLMTIVWAVARMS